MSGKSALKACVMREPPFSEALHLAEDTRALVPPSAADNVTMVVEDASVRYAAGPGSRGTAALTGGPSTGNDLLQAFWRPVEAAFSMYPTLDTYVLLFDKKQYVPTQKANTQASRRSALTESARRTDVDAWTWDGATSIVEKSKPLPPWARLRLDGRAYKRALDELVALMAAEFTPPIGARIVFDWTEMPLVIESDKLGQVRGPYPDPSMHNTAGEADMGAQWYATKGRNGYFMAPERPLDGVPVRGHPIQTSVQDAYYEGYTVPGGVLDRAAPLRTVYRVGSIVLRSTDTDYFPLSMLHLALDAEAGAEFDVFLAIGTCSVKQSATTPVFCTRNSPGAALRSEIYSVRKLCQAAASLHPPGTPLRDAITSFVAFCTACGNDYVTRRYGLTHKHMFAAYQTSLIRTTWCPTVDDMALLCPDSFVAWLLQCYRQRLGKRQLATGTWTQIGQIARTAFSKPEAWLPTEAETKAYFDAAAWALAYACTGPRGHAWTPP